MAVQRVKRLTEFLQEEVGDQLRSVIAYSEEGYNIVFLRDDLQGVYTDEDLDQIMESSRLEAFERPLILDSYADDHGGLTCQVKCFEHAVEVNIILTEFAGIAIGMDGGVFQDGRFLGQIRKIAQGDKPKQ